MRKATCAVITAGLSLGIAIAAQNACADSVTSAEQAPQNVPAKSVGTAKSEKPPVTGKVLEAISSGGYTYILLGKDGKKAWVAVPSAEVTVGQEVRVKPGLEMGRYESKSLKRTFDNIIFSPGLATDAKGTTGKTPAETATPQQPAEQPGVKDKAKPKGMAAMFGSGGGETSGNLSGKVVETKDAGGYTYINLEKDGKQTWAAVPTMKVTVGEEMELQPGAVMTNFTSKSLNKTFERVVFSGGPVKSR